MAELEQFASTLEKLAQITGVSSRMWGEYSRNGKDFPARTKKGFDVQKCLEWKAANVRDRTATGNKAELEEQKLQEQIRNLRIKNEREERKLLSADEVARLHLFVATRAKSKLYQCLETEAPPRLDGLSAAEQRPILRGIADQIADEMADLFEQFQKQ